MSAMSETEKLTTFVLKTPLKTLLHWLKQNVHELHNDSCSDLGRPGKALLWLIRQAKLADVGVIKPDTEAK
eukprot:3090767-Rhodomonas_salina.2